ncbi:hypothetical protein [Roseofilum casamattae]|uniref:Uncharacterized protein n=1 Tax=Roseofilum casamattae BLCC-M143 TaxID=3022442 RepID=A0ABT7C040_9CYAN|nr:hypothetical protein [Roseofilum casamattae]MDJ1184817.1 hypothetical protein [Roseofilum casamattae BLCC-M143]
MEPNRVHESEDSQQEGYRQLVDAIRALKRNDRMLHNLMLMECWSIVRTMDELNAGFWSEYMKNHQQVAQQRLKQWQAEKKAEQNKQRTTSLSRKTSPFESAEEAQSAQEKLSERIALFSESITQEFTTESWQNPPSLGEDREV